MSSSKLKINLHIFLFTISRTLINGSLRIAFPFLPVFARGLGVEPASLAMAFSIRALVGAFGPFLSTLADTYNRKMGILLGVGLFTVGTGIVGFWPALWSFIVGTSLVVLGNNVFLSSANAYLGDHVPYEKRGRVLSITETSWALAFILVVPVVRFLIESYSWVTPFYFFAAVGVLFFVILFWQLPINHIPKSKENTLWKNLGRVFRTWPALAGLLMGLSFTMANEMVNLIFGVWIEDQFGVNFAALAAASVVIGVSELGGEVSSGILMDAVGKRRIIWLFLGLNSLAAILLPVTHASLLWAMVGLGFFYVTFEIVLVSALTLMTEVLPAARATILALTVAGFSLGRMMGDLIAPGLYGINFWSNVLATVMLNIVAAGLLTQVRVRDR